jgi:hypothetical protein
VVAQYIWRFGVSRIANPTYIWRYSTPPKAAGQAANSQKALILDQTPLSLFPVIELLDYTTAIQRALAGIHPAEVECVWLDLNKTGSRSSTRACLSIIAGFLRWTPTTCCRNADVKTPKNMKRILTMLAIFLAAAGTILTASFFAPLSIPYYQDFSVMYFTNKGLLNGISIYDYPAQLAFIKTLTPAGFTFHPYPYPPWYALATIYLGLLPIEVAARTWFFLNLAMIGCAAWLLTPRWKPIPRILAAFVAIMFIPAFGLLIVGQYSAPVLLGAALFIHAVKRKLPFWTAVALLLMTFKPHIGGILFLAGFGWLVYECHSRKDTGTTCRPPMFFRRRSNLQLIDETPLNGGLLRSPSDGSLAMTSFARRALIGVILGGLFLALLGFAAGPAWPLTYLQSLGRYRDIPGVQNCGLCASLSVALVRLATGQSNTGMAAWVSLILAAGAGILLFWRYRAHLKDSAALTALSAILTLLIDPYLLNYDYILLLIPLFWLARREKWAIPVYFIPWAGLALGRNGNILLSLAGLVTFFLILRQPIDAPSGEA